MNRPVKFRVWDNELKKFGNPDQYGLILRYGLIHGKEKHPEYGIYYNPDVIIQQYTGLNDSNGKDIYEGDIVKTIYDDELSTGVVMYNCELGAYRIKTKKHLLPIVTHRFVEDKPIGLITVADKVIGNIFENPELLT